MHRRVFVHVDNDIAGERRAHKVIEALRGLADAITVVRYPDSGSGGDVSDWLSMGNGIDALLERCFLAGDSNTPLP